ncbi:hypothetical protein U1Q18_024941 [Sarracenia purpurea var. burkii]
MSATITYEDLWHQGARRRSDDRDTCDLVTEGNALRRWSLMVSYNEFGVLASLDSENSEEMFDDKGGRSRGSRVCSIQSNAIGRIPDKIESDTRKRERKVTFLLPTYGFSKKCTVDTSIVVGTGLDKTNDGDDVFDRSMEEDENNDEYESAESIEKEEGTTS